VEGGGNVEGDLVSPPTVMNVFLRPDDLDLVLTSIELALDVVNDTVTRQRLEVLQRRLMVLRDHDHARASDNGMPER
jgi:hypothetical protein